MNNSKFEIKMMGVITQCNFYIPDDTGDINGMSFRMAYKAAKYSKNNKDLCACIGSMLCSVVPAFRTSIEKALSEICIRPQFISLPSQANEKKIVESELPPLDWPSILVTFGYCIHLLSHYYYTGDFHTHMLNCIRDLKAIVRCDPGSKLEIPFDAIKEDAVTTMLSSPQLKETVRKFLIANMNHTDSLVSRICNYLRNKSS
ncbi:unnamed protein product [Lathyrus sativus]|nr:unnamed protein product [Lathyrus sativus]